MTWSSSIFELMLTAFEQNSSPTNRFLRHLTLPINITHLVVNICMLYTEKWSTFHIGPNSKHILSSFNSHFMCSVMNALWNIVHCFVFSERKNSIFTCIMLQRLFYRLKVVLSTLYTKFKKKGTDDITFGTPLVSKGWCNDAKVFIKNTRDRGMQSWHRLNHWQKF